MAIRHREQRKDVPSADGGVPVCQCSRNRSGSAGGEDRRGLNWRSSAVLVSEYSKAAWTGLQEVALRTVCWAHVASKAAGGQERRATRRDAGPHSFDVMDRTPAERPLGLPESAESHFRRGLLEACTSRQDARSTIRLSSVTPPTSPRPPVVAEVEAGEVQRSGFAGDQEHRVACGAVDERASRGSPVS